MTGPLEKPLKPGDPVRMGSQEQYRRTVGDNIGDLAREVIKRVASLFKEELKKAPYQDTLMVSLEEKMGVRELFLDDDSEDAIDVFKEKYSSSRIISDVDVYPKQFLYKDVYGKGLKFFAISMKSLKKQFRLGELSSEKCLKERVNVLDKSKVKRYNELLDECVSEMLRLENKDHWFVINMIGAIESLNYKDQFPRSIFLRGACLNAIGSLP